MIGIPDDAAQAKFSTIGFDFLSYARGRLKQYQRQKQAALGMLNHLPGADLD